MKDNRTFSGKSYGDSEGTRVDVPKGSAVILSHPFEHDPDWIEELAKQMREAKDTIVLTIPKGWDFKIVDAPISVVEIVPLREAGK